MAASPEQKLKARLALGVTKEDAVKTIAAGDDENGLNYLLDQLDAAELTELDALLVKAEELALDATKIKAEGVDMDPARERGLVIDRLCALVGIGVDLGFYTVGDPYDG